MADETDEIIIEIRIQKIGGTSFLVNVRADEMIWEIKDMITAVEGSAAYQQRLMFGETILEDFNNLLDYNIQDKSTIQLVICESLCGRRCTPSCGVQVCCEYNCIAKNSLEQFNVCSQKTSTLCFHIQNDAFWYQQIIESNVYKNLPAFRNILHNLLPGLSMSHSEMRRLKHYLLDDLDSDEMGSDSSRSNSSN